MVKRFFDLKYACGFAVAFVVFSAICAGADPSLEIVASGQDYNLISSTPGLQELRVTLPQNKGAASVRAEVRGYDNRALLMPKVISTNTVSLSKSGAADVKMPMVLSKPGLYEITLSALDSQENVLGTKKVSYAVVPPRKAVGPSDFGVCVHLTARGDSTKERVGKVLSLIKLAGFSRIRDEMYWQQVERVPGEFVFEEQQDRVINMAAKLRLSPLIILDYGNAKAYPEEFAKNPDNSIFPQTPETRALFANYVKEVVSRYKKQVKEWEVWNEPHAWGNPSTENYTLLLKDVFTTIKGIAPDSVVIGCGGGGGGGGPGGDYVNEVIRHGGLNSMDGFSIHPYMTPPLTPDMGYPVPGAPIPRVSIPLVSQHLKSLVSDQRNILNNGKELGVWVTEYGAFSSPVKFADGEPFQALYLARAYLLSRRFSTFEAIYWYDFQDDGTNPTNPEHNFGLIREDFSPKPAYVAAAVLTNRLGKRKWKQSLAEDNTLVEIHQFGEDKDPVIVGWAKHDLNFEIAPISIPSGKYTLVDWQGSEKTVEVKSGRYNFNAGPLPQYLIPQK